MRERSSLEQAGKARKTGDFTVTLNPTSNGAPRPAS
jgi:hypothetical protein